MTPNRQPIDSDSLDTPGAPALRGYAVDYQDGYSLVVIAATAKRARYLAACHMAEAWRLDYGYCSGDRGTVSYWLIRGRSTRTFRAQWKIDQGIVRGECVLGDLL